MFHKVTTKYQEQINVFLRWIFYMLKGHITTFIEHYMEGKIRENIENWIQIFYMYNYQSPTHIILLLIFISFVWHYVTNLC